MKTRIVIELLTNNWNKLSTSKHMQSVEYHITLNIPQPILFAKVNEWTGFVIPEVLNVFIKDNVNINGYIYELF